MSSPLERSVFAAVAAVLGGDGGEAIRHATVLADLGADWLDLVDILLRVERSTGVRLRAADLAAHLEDRAGRSASAAELRRLQRLLPQLDLGPLAGRLGADHRLARFTAGDLAALIALRGAAPSRDSAARAA